MNCIACMVNLENKPRINMYYQLERQGLWMYAGVCCNSNVCYCKVQNIIIKEKKAFKVK